MSNPKNVQVTNDGATILKSIGVDNPAAKVLVGELPKLFNNLVYRLDNGFSNRTVTQHVSSPSLSVCVSIYLSIYLSTHLFVSFSFFLSLSFSFKNHVHLFLFLFFHP